MQSTAETRVRERSSTVWMYCCSPTQTALYVPISIGNTPTQKVYRLATHHPIAHKVAVIWTLYRRAEAISSSVVATSVPHFSPLVFLLVYLSEPIPLFLHYVIDEDSCIAAKTFCFPTHLWLVNYNRINSHVCT